MAKQEFLSLYDYLGRAAGKDLGEEVFFTAKNNGVEWEERHVSNSRYKGNVKLYPKSFLETYFKPVEEYTPEDKIDFILKHLNTLTKRVEMLENKNYHEEDDLPF